MTHTQFSTALLSISTPDSDARTTAMTESTKPLHSRSLLRAYSPSLLTLLQQKRRYKYNNNNKCIYNHCSHYYNNNNNVTKTTTTTSIFTITAHVTTTTTTLQKQQQQAYLQSLLTLLQQQVRQQDAYPANRQERTAVTTMCLQRQHLNHSLHASIYSTRRVTNNVSTRLTLPTITLPSCDKYLTLESITAGPSCDINISPVDYSLSHVCRPSPTVNKHRCTMHQWISFMTQSDDIMLENTQKMLHIWPHTGGPGRTKPSARCLYLVRKILSS